MDTNTQLNTGLTESLLQVNQLSYKLPPQISIASKCTHVINYSQQASYNGGETVIFDCQTGSQFVDPAASYLRLVVTPSDSTHGFGSGSVNNIFSRVVVRTQTGAELSRCEDYNLLNKFMERYANSTSWIDTIGKAQGYSNNVGASGTVYCDAVPATGKVFIVPVQCLMACMNPIGAKLVPPNIMSGLRIEIQLANANDAFCSANQSAKGALTSYTVNRPEMHWKVFELADAFQRKIQEMAAQGLNYLYKEYFHTIVSTSTADINFDIKKAASKALTCRIITRGTTVVDGDDKFAAAVFNYNTLQANIGENYWPNQKLQIDTTPTLNNIHEAYYYTAYAVDKLEAWAPPSVTPNQFLGTVVTGAVTDEYSNGMICFNLNKSNVSELAGYTTSNSRALLVNLKQHSANAVRLDAYLTFLRLCKVLVSNTVVLD
jgi:hypothetical protein